MGVDGVHLLSALVRKQNGETARDVLVTHARLSNGVATSFLKLDKEVGLMRYCGFRGYLREKQIGVSLPHFAKRLIYGSTSTIGTGGDPGDPSDPKKKDKKNVAKVAFMITSTQRIELSERLGYRAKDIKKLKPVEASLILQHNVSPTEVDDKLAGLVQDYNDTLAREHQEAKLEAEKLASQNLAMAQTPFHQESSDKEDTLFGNIQREATNEGKEISSDENQSSSALTGATRLWFEVVETRVSDGSAIPVALYKNEEEAKMCLELKEGFSARRAREKGEDPATTYAIRKTVK